MQNVNSNHFKFKAVTKALIGNSFQKKFVGQNANI